MRTCANKSDTQTHWKGLAMRRLIAVMLATSTAGCVPLPDSAAICSGTVSLRKAHAGALLADGGPRSKDTGERLLSGLKAGCKE